jgi:hypothetical protein
MKAPVNVDNDAIAWCQAMDEREGWFTGNGNALAYYASKELHMVTMTADIDTTLLRLTNKCIPNDLWLSGKNDRWWVTEPDGLRRPYHRNIHYIRGDDGRWRYWGNLPHPDRTGIPKPIQHLVRKWAASDVFENKGCSLCVFDQGKMMAQTIDGGRYLFASPTVRYTIAKAYAYNTLRRAA